MRGDKKDSMAANAGTNENAGTSSNEQGQHIGVGRQSEVRYRGWKAMPCVIGNETFEKLGSIGTASNLMVYLTSVFHMSNVKAATVLNVFQGTTNLATVVGAFVSDSYLGRYSTVGLGTIASLLGMILLTITAGIPALHPPKCTVASDCASATGPQNFVLIAAFVFIIVGAGGIRPCNLAFGADQFNPNTDSGRKGISSFFNWYYFTLTIAVGISSTLIIYIQSNLSWFLGFAIPAALMFISCIFFYGGAKIYVKVKPEGSPFTGIVRVCVAAFRKRRLSLPGDPADELFQAPHVSSIVSKLPHTDQFNFLDKAAVISSESDILPDGTAKNPWLLCGIQQVEETKCILRTLPIWTTTFIYYMAFTQTTTYIIVQALQSDRHIGKKIEVPGATFTIFPVIALTIWLPLYDQLLLPWLQKIGGADGGLTLLQRMGIGLALSIIAMIVSGIIEARRRYYALLDPIPKDLAYGGGAISSLSSFWLVLPLSIMGLAEAFNNVSQLEFYYKQFPENMRSVAGSLLFSGYAISSYLSSLLITIVSNVTRRNQKDSWLSDDLNKGRLDCFYYLIAGIGVLNLLYFLAIAKWYRYKEMADTQRHNQILV